MNDARTDKTLLQDFPTKRIKPFDGLAVTAQVWDEAHGYHRQRHRFHELLSHGPGIVSGLKVIASDPPDTSVYILPGVAVDAAGRAIVLNEPVTYDVGDKAEGRLYLLLSYGERQSKSEEHGPVYVHSEFGIEVQPRPDDTRSVELARIRRQKRDAPIFDPQDPAHPGPNEIDLRFRRDVGAATQETVSLAVINVGGGAKSVRHSEGADYMARAFNRCGWADGQYRLCVDHDIAIGPDLAAYALVYLVGHGAFQLGKEDMEALYAYMERGGTLFIESCRHGNAEGEPAADTSFYNLMSELGVALNELRSDHRLLREPFLFAASPAGFETEGAPRVAVGEAAIFSTYDYGCLWQGEQRGGSASREAIRAALEWGSNVVAYAVSRRERAQG
jgi:hypothetical protein